MSSKPAPEKSFIDMDPNDSLASSGHSDFSGAVVGITDGGTEWDTVNKITEPYNTYPCSISPHTKFTLEDIHLRLGGVSSVTMTIQFISDTGYTHDMDTKYGSFLSYNCSSSGNYVTIENG